MKIAVILGTRPEIIKMAPVVRALQAEAVDYFILHTGQHYSADMDALFFQELELPQPRYNLNTGSGLHGESTGRMLAGIEKVLLQEQPQAVLVEGDTNSVLAGALAAAKLHIRVGHVEAGLRSYDRQMPEEINRILTDHISDYLFAPTAQAAAILQAEGIPPSTVHVTGNTIVDAVQQNIEIARRRSGILEKLELAHGGYFLVTLHRQENVDDPARLRDILHGLEQAGRRYNLPLFFPVHPRTMTRLEQFGLALPQEVKPGKPLGFMDFLTLEASAAAALTDSGGVQEECCILKVPCVTLRENTERPETLEAGANFLAGSKPERILEGLERMLAAPRNWLNPFGDGHAAERIVELVQQVPGASNPVQTDR